MTKKDFFKKKCIRIENAKTQHTGSFSNTRSNGYRWQMYVCVLLFEPFNPYLKSNENRPYKLFQSGFSSNDCKEKAWEYIHENLL